MGETCVRPMIKSGQNTMERCSSSGIGDTRLPLSPSAYATAIRSKCSWVLGTPRARLPLYMFPHSSTISPF